MLSFVHEDEKLVGIIGTVKTEIPDIPFVSLDNLLSDQGIKLVFQMLGFDLAKDENQAVLKKSRQHIFKACRLKPLLIYWLF